MAPSAKNAVVAGRACSLSMPALQTGAEYGPAHLNSAIARVFTALCRSTAHVLTPVGNDVRRRHRGMIQCGAAPRAIARAPTPAQGKTSGRERGAGKEALRASPSPCSLD